MKKILCAACCAALGAIGFVACDAMPPENVAVSEPLEAEAPAAGKTLADVVREALADVVRDKDAFSRARRLGTLLPTLGPEMVPAVKQTLDDRMLELRATEIELLVRYWATHQPEDAARWAKEKSPVSYREGAVFAALSVWAEADPQTAVDVAWGWAMEQPNLERIVPIALMRGWFAANDPPELQQYLRDRPIGIPRQRAVAAYIVALTQSQGAEAAQRWAESLPDDNPIYKLDVYRRLVDLMSTLDLDAALRWCETQCYGPYGNSMRSIIARNWVLHQDGGPAALKWLSNSRAGNEKDLALRITFALWARRDREAAMNWMAAQTTGEPEPWLRPLYPVYARLLSGDAPADAIKWAERIEDDKEREIVLIGVARVWRTLDEAAAEEWLLQSSLSEEAREKARAASPRKAAQAND